jgi:hypothetical protein
MGASKTEGRRLGEGTDGEPEAQLPSGGQLVATDIAQDFNLGGRGHKAPAKKARVQSAAGKVKSLMNKTFSIWQDNCLLCIERNRHVLFRLRGKAAVDETSANAAS